MFRLNEPHKNTQYIDWTKYLERHFPVVTSFVCLFCSIRVRLCIFTIPKTCFQSFGGIFFYRKLQLTYRFWRMVHPAFTWMLRLQYSHVVTQSIHTFTLVCACFWKSNDMTSEMVVGLTFFSYEDSAPIYLSMETCKFNAIECAYTIDLYRRQIQGHGLGGAIHDFHIL